MLIKIIKTIYDKYFKCGGNYLQGIFVMFLNNGFIQFFIKLENKKNKHKLYFNIIQITNIIITFIIFLIFYKFNINLFSNEFILNYSKYIWFMFIFYIIKILLSVFFGIYIYIKVKNINYLKDSLKSILNLIHFLINIKILFFFFNINFILFLQYNIIFIISNISFILFFFYTKWLSWNLKGESFNNFINFPWIYILIIVLLFIFCIDKGSKFCNLFSNYCLWDDLSSDK